MGYWSDIFLAYGLYVVATGSPGPATMAIMGVAMSVGRDRALAMVCGVIIISIGWATLAATGLTALVKASGEAFMVIKIIGGLYLLWLGFRSARSALTPGVPELHTALPAGRWTFFRRGIAIHATNPKAAFAWVAIVSISLKPDAPWWVAVALVAGCAILGCLTFGSYALLFSTAPMVRLYQRSRRAVEGVMAVLFGAAGIKLMTTRFD